MKLRNIGVVLVEGQLQGVYTDKSKWAAWHVDPAIEASVVQRQQRNVVAGPNLGRRQVSILAMFRPTKRIRRDALISRGHVAARSTCTLQILVRQYYVTRI